MKGRLKTPRFAERTLSDGLQADERPTFTIWRILCPAKPF